MVPKNDYQLATALIIKGQEHHLLYKTINLTNAQINKEMIQFFQDFLD